MNRFITAALAGALAAGFALPQAHAIGGAQFIAKNGVKFNFGMTLEIVPTYAEDLDLNDKAVNAGGVFGNGVTSDERGVAIGTENRLYFKLRKDRVEAYVLIEWDGGLDEQAIDANDPNIERIRISLDLPQISSKINVAADIFLQTTVGRLVYLDDDPGIWLTGGKDNITWQVSWHHRRERSGRAGDSGGVTTGGGIARTGDGSDQNLFGARMQFKGKTGGGSKWLIEPAVLFVNRNHTQGATAVDAEENVAYLSLGGDLNLGIARFRVEGVYQTGDIDGLTPLAGGASGFGAGGTANSMDIDAFALHASVQLDLSKTGWPLGGVKPYFAWDFMSGDDDVTDNDLEGYTAVSVANGLRWDSAAFGFGRLSAAGHLPFSTGCQCIQFGFDTHNIGTGPSTGGILDNAPGDNPGIHIFKLGIGGKLNPKWGLHARILHLRYDELAAIIASGAATAAAADEEMGTGFDINVRYWPQKQLYIQPFFSVFFPGDGVEAIVGNDTTGMMGGVKFFANF